MQMQTRIPELREEHLVSYFLAWQWRKAGEDRRNYSNCWKLLQTLEVLGEKASVSVFICISPATVGEFFSVSMETFEV